MTREEAIELLEDLDGAIEDNHGRDYDEAFRMAIKALSSNSISKAYAKGYVDGAVNATINSNYVCPRCGETMQHDRSHKESEVEE